MAWRCFYFHSIKGLTFSSGILPSGFSGHDVCMRCSLAWSHWRGEGGTHWWTREFRRVGRCREAITQRIKSPRHFFTCWTQIHEGGWFRWFFLFLIWGDFLASKMLPCWWASTSINPAIKIISWVSFFLCRRVGAEHNAPWRIFCKGVSVCTARPYHFKWSKQIQAPRQVSRDNTTSTKSWENDKLDASLNQ